MEKVVLLLSGGKDSKKCLELLLQAGFDVTGLCISGRQKVEEPQARKTAEQFGVPIVVVPVFFFDETTWNPVKLIIRDLAMGAVAIAVCWRLKAKRLATGVKIADIENAQLKWLGPFLRFATFALKLFGIRLIFPLMDRELR